MFYIADFITDLKLLLPGFKIVCVANEITISTAVSDLGPLRVAKLVYEQEDEIMQISFIKASELIEGCAKEYYTAIPINDIYNYTKNSLIQNCQEVKTYIDTNISLDYIENTLINLDFTFEVVRNCRDSLIPVCLCYSQNIDSETTVQIEVFDNAFNYIYPFNVFIIKNGNSIFTRCAGTLDELLNKLMEQ